MGKGVGGGGEEEVEGAVKEELIEGECISKS